MIKNDTYQNIMKLLNFLKLSRVNVWFFVLSVFLSLCFTLSATYAAILLFPLTAGIIKNNFTSVESLWGISFIVKHYPTVFNSSISLFILLVLWIYLLTIVKDVFQYFSFLTTQIQAKLATVKLREMLIVKCLSFGKSFYDNNTISYLQTSLTKSTGLIESQFGLFQELVSQSFLMLAYVIIMVSISFKLTLIAAVFFPVITFLTQRIILKIQKASLEHKRLSTSLNEKVFNMLYCMPLIKGFGKEQEEVSKFSKAAEEEIEQSFKIQRLLNLSIPLQDIGTMTGILFVAFGMAHIMHFENTLEPSKAFVFFYLATKIIPGLNAFNRFKLGATKTATSLQDIEYILNQDESSKVLGGNVVFTGLKSCINVKDLSFSYAPKCDLVLDQMSFSVEKGSIVAIVGPSGSGKSTLVNLLLRFYDCPSSSIFIDGRDIREYDISTLRRHISFVSQEALLFNDTIRNNIVYGSRLDNVSDKFLEDLGDKIQINDFVDKMPNKYETSVVERGGRLSGGERQRLSIARAIIRDPEILILDEATSSLDSETEAKINDFITSFSKEKTLIIIAHRLSTIKKADKVICIENGRVIESGNLEELISKKGSFYKLLQAQTI
ncbi:MAG: ABC transporter ATP-binding protein [Candidatus Omnitrophota bacterium]